MRKRPVRMCAHAKLNLVLAVGPRRRDGYHEIATLLTAISLHDTLVFTPRARGFALTVDGPEARGVPRTGANLVLKAARALEAELGERRGATIRLTKRVPHGAGLGGGSSDAAATLHGLLRLWGRRLPRVRLLELAAGLGSDVPFFLVRSPAFATGRGEILEELPPFEPPLRFVVVVPKVRVATSWAYRQYTIPKTRLTVSKSAATLLQLRAKAVGRSKLKRKVSNDLETAVVPRVLQVREALLAVYAAGANEAGMSGSGSAVFGLVVSPGSPGRVAGKLREQGHKVYVTRSSRAGSRPCR